MYIDFMLFTVIALTTNLIILVRILSSNMKSQEKGFMHLIMLAIFHNVVDIFWGLTYFDRIGMGALGLKISTSLYFCSNAILAFTWFLFLCRLLYGDKPKRWFLSVTAIPMALVIFMVIANFRTEALFTIGETVDSYARGKWYVIERIGTTGYLAVIGIWSLIKLLSASEKTERKKYSIITAFAVVPIVFDLLQVFFVAVPCTSVAFQIAIIIVYAFVSVERSENVLFTTSERQKNNMRSALAQTAMSWYEFNADRDCVYDSKIYLEKDIYVKKPRKADLKYSDYYNFLLGRVFPEYAESYRETFSLDNLKKNFENGKNELSLRYWITDRTGAELYILQNIILTQDSVTKEIIGFAYTRDITAEEKQKREIEEQLEEIQNLNTELEEKQKELETLGAEQKLQIEKIQKFNDELNNRFSIIQSMSKIYFASFFIDLVNDTFEEIRTIQGIRNLIGTGGKVDEAMNLICDNLVTPETSETLRRFFDMSDIDERMRNTDVITCEYVGVTSGWCRMHMIVGDRADDGSIKTLFIASRMIHDEKLREEEQNRIIEEARIAAERANKAKTEFFFNMSHDIRTPMNAIIGFTDLLEKYQDIPEKRADYLQKIKGSNKVLLSIINNVLEMASIEKGSIEFNETEWSVTQFHDTLYSVFQDMMIQKNIKFTSKVDVEHNYFFCDTGKIREIFINILSNAYKYTNPGGKVHMHIEELVSDREGYVLFRTTVSDTGLGMSEDFIDRIFEEFAREKSVTDCKIEGTGLGMPIVKRLIDCLGGSIEVNSKKGVGSEFIVTLPHRIADRSDLADNENIVVKPELFRNKRILLAEDNELNAEIAIEILKEADFEIDRVSDGQAVVDTLKAADDGYYDLIIMDIQMPKMNGYEASRAIRKLPDATKANIPILAMTANAFEEDKKDAMNAGMNGHLGKPIDVNELMKMLALLLK